MLGPVCTGVVMHGATVLGTAIQGRRHGMVDLGRLGHVTVRLGKDRGMARTGAWYGWVRWVVFRSGLARQYLF